MNLTCGLNIHRLSMAAFLKNLRSHVAGGTACRGQNVKLLFIHDSRKTKVGNEEVCIVFGSAEKEILGLQVAMYNAVIVKVCDSREGGPYEVGSIRLVVGTLSADTVKQLSTEGEICYEVYWGCDVQFGERKLFKQRTLTVIHRLKVVDKRQDILVAHGYALQDGNLIAYHVFPSGHKPLVDDLCGIVSSSVNVYAFLHDRV